MLIQFSVSKILLILIFHDHLCKDFLLLLGEHFDCGVNKSCWVHLLLLRGFSCSSGGQSFAICPVFLQQKHFPCLSSVALSSMVNALISIALGSFFSVVLHQCAFPLLLLVSDFFDKLAFVSWLRKRFPILQFMLYWMALFIHPSIVLGTLSLNRILRLSLGSKAFLKYSMRWRWSEAVFLSILACPTICRNSVMSSSTVFFPCPVCLLHLVLNQRLRMLFVCPQRM
jgi:hypothetical protein